MSACFYLLNAGVVKNNYLKHYSDKDEHLPKEAIDIIDYSIAASMLTSLFT